MASDPLTIDDNRFKDTNTTTFAPPWSSDQIAWWVANMLSPHGSPVSDMCRQLDLADLVPDPTTDPVFMAAARAAVIAGGNIPWRDRVEAKRKEREARAERDEREG